MRAVTQNTYGSAGVFQLCEVDRPDIGGDEVLIRVHGAGVDRGVWHLMTGLPYVGRLAFGLQAPKTAVPGMDLAGVVAAVGDHVTRFRPGDEVFGIGKGAYAEYARAAEAKLAPKPTNLTFAQAAAVPISGLTALQAVRDHGEVSAGDRVLIVGASGGVGTYAVQLAKAFGAHVTGVCSSGKVDLVRSLGADHVIDYAREDFAARAERYDVIVDIGGGSSLARLRQTLTSNGTLVIVGSEGGGRWFGGIDRQLRASMLSPFIGQKLGSFINRENHQDMLVLKQLIETGDVTPAIDRTFPLEAAGDAVQYVAAGRTRGKAVIAVDASGGT